MEIIARREIDVSNYTPEDLEFCYPKGAQLSIELDGSNTVGVQGHSALSDTYYTLPIIEKQTYDIVTSASNAGVYDVDISSVDKFTLSITGSGKIYIKVIGG